MVLQSRVLYPTKKEEKEKLFWATGMKPVAIDSRMKTQHVINRVGQLKKPLYDKMREIANEKDFRIDFINGVEDHGITNSWVNKNQLTLDYFEWQDGFSAFSVSPLQLQKHQILLDCATGEIILQQ
eukprot:gene36200-48745_t